MHFDWYVGLKKLFAENKQHHFRLLQLATSLAPMPTPNTNKIREIRVKWHEKESQISNELVTRFVTHKNYKISYQEILR